MPSCLRLRRHLGLGEVDLRAHEAGGLLAQVADEPAERPGVLRCVGPRVARPSGVRDHSTTFHLRRRLLPGGLSVQVARRANSREGGAAASWSGVDELLAGACPGSGGAPSAGWAVLRHGARRDGAGRCPVGQHSGPTAPDRGRSAVRDEQRRPRSAVRSRASYGRPQRVARSWSTARSSVVSTSGLSSQTGPGHARCAAKRSTRGDGT